MSNPISHILLSSFFTISLYHEVNSKKSPLRTTVLFGENLYLDML